MAMATHRQTERYLKPLLRKLKAKVKSWTPTVCRLSLKEYACCMLTNHTFWVNTVLSLGHTIRYSGFFN